MEQIKDRITAAFPGAQVEIIPNASPSNQPSLLLDAAHARQIAQFLRDEPELRFDYASNVTGVDWPEKTVKEKVKVKKIIDGVEKEVEELAERKTPACLEAVYHLYSMALGHGPSSSAFAPAIAPTASPCPPSPPFGAVANSRNAKSFDLFGIQFEAHPDLRRILMWDNFADHPMRKDYVPAASP